MSAVGVEWRVIAAKYNEHRERANRSLAPYFTDLPCSVLAANRVIRTRLSFGPALGLSHSYSARARGSLASSLALIRTIIALVVIILRYIIAAHSRPSSRLLFFSLSLVIHS